MYIDQNDERPIFVQIAEQIEDAILSGAFPEESRIPSTTEISSSYKINPATVLKGINILVDNEIVYKKRGLGMYVCDGAVEKLKNNRKDSFYEKFVKTMLEEAKRLGITSDEIISMTKKFEEEHGNEHQN